MSISQGVADAIQKLDELQYELVHTNVRHQGLKPSAHVSWYERMRQYIDLLKEELQKDEEARDVESAVMRRVYLDYENTDVQQ